MCLSLCEVRTRCCMPKHKISPPSCFALSRRYGTENKAIQYPFCTCVHAYACVIVPSLPFYLCLYIGRSENQVLPTALVLRFFRQHALCKKHVKSLIAARRDKMLKRNRKEKVFYLWSTHTRLKYHCFDLPIQCKTVNQIFAPAS